MTMISIDADPEALGRTVGMQAVRNSRQRAVSRLIADINTGVLDEHLFELQRAITARTQTLVQGVMTE